VQRDKAHVFSTSTCCVRSRRRFVTAASLFAKPSLQEFQEVTVSTKQQQALDYDLIDLFVAAISE
jgi:hypothetical protein